MRSRRFHWRIIIDVWQIIVLAAMQGFINAVDTPARQAFLVELVEDRRDLSNAIALNSSMFNGARLIGPSIAGLLYAEVGAGYCFLIDGISYIAVIAALLAMRVKPHVEQPRKHNIWHDLVEGYFYVYRLTPLRAIFLLLGLVSIFGIPYGTLMPVFADSLASDAEGHAVRVIERAAHCHVGDCGRHFSSSPPPAPASTASCSPRPAPALSAGRCFSPRGARSSVLAE